MSKKKGKGGAIAGGVALVLLGIGLLTPGNEAEPVPLPSPTAVIESTPIPPAKSTSKPQPTAGTRKIPGETMPTPTPKPIRTAAPTAEPVDERLQQLVYTTQSGKCYHNAGCGTIEGSTLTERTIAEALEKNYRPCKECKPYCPD